MAVDFLVIYVQKQSFIASFVYFSSCWNTLSPSSFIWIFIGFPRVCEDWVLNIERENEIACSNVELKWGWNELFSDLKYVDGLFCGLVNLICLLMVWFSWSKWMGTSKRVIYIPRQETLLWDCLPVLTNLTCFTVYSCFSDFLLKKIFCVILLYIKRIFERF